MKTVQLYVRRIFNLNGELIRFTMIELLMKYTCQPCNYVLYYKRE